MFLRGYRFRYKVFAAECVSVRRSGEGEILAGLRVFVSSTCFDLGSQRDQLRSLLSRMGYEPIMSDYSDVLYDPNDHTHTSCVKDVVGADMIVLMIGGRFGGKAVPQALPTVDFDLLSKASTSAEILKETENLSITQLEILKSVEMGIPLFAFVDDGIYADHHVYQANKSGGIADKIKYPSIDKPETARYIFEFINFITHRSSNNSITSYGNFSDIEGHLIKQWSMLFQRLLRDQREGSIEQRRSDVVIDQIEGLKAVVLQSISGGQERETAKAVIKYRRVIDIVLGLNGGPNRVDVVNFVGDFFELMTALDIQDVRDHEDGGMNRSYWVLTDGTFFQARLSARFLNRLSIDWEKFTKLDHQIKVAVIDALSDVDVGLPIVRYFHENVEEYLTRRGNSEVDNAFRPTEAENPFRRVETASVPVSTKPAKTKEPGGKSTPAA